jgi:hypothetical protein
MPGSWDEVVGSLVMVQLRFCREGEIVHRYQYAGRVVSASDEVVMLETRSGAIATMPPHLDGFLPVDPGEYELPATGETVVDPDWFVPWRIDLTDDQAPKVTYVPRRWVDGQPSSQG